MFNGIILALVVVLVPILAIGILGFVENGFYAFLVTSLLFNIYLVIQINRVKKS